MHAHHTSFLYEPPSGDAVRQIVMPEEVHTLPGVMQDTPVPHHGDFCRQQGEFCILFWTLLATNVNQNVKV